MKSAQSDVQVQHTCPVGNQGLNHVYSKNPQLFTWTVITAGDAQLSPSDEKSPGFWWSCYLLWLLFLLCVRMLHDSCV